MLRPRFKLEEGWTSVLLLLLMLLCVVWSVRAAEWTDGLGVLQWIAIAATLLGLALTQWRRVPALVAHLLGLAMGVAWVAIMLSLVFNSPLVPAGLAPPGQDLWAKVNAMAQQVLRWFLNPSSAEPWLSNWMFVVALAAVTWLLCYVSVWFIFRWHWVWGAVVPAGVACLLNLYYAPPSLTLYLALYCLCALLLIVRLHVYTRQKAWREAAVNYGLDVDLTFVRDGALIAVLAVALAWTIPAAAASPHLADLWATFQDPWHQVQSQWSRWFTALNYRGESRWVNFQRTLTLGGAVNLSNTPVLEVKAEQPYYWRAVSYDQYTGAGWVDTDKVELALTGSNARLQPASYALQQEFTYTVRFLEPGEGMLFFTGQPLRVGFPARARLSYLPGADATPSLDVSVLYAAATLRRNSSYTGVSRVSAAGWNQLRADGTDYPGWVVRYLQLPSTLPDRIRRLSREVTAEASTPYDRVQALQDYLRRITYDQYISAPPPGRDVVDWFLFESRKGYCDYYASAMAVMCRAIGIPARVVQGYSTGEFIAASQTYRVRQMNAHAWVEVFFPHFGWIEFEPTSSQPVISRPENSALPLPVGLPTQPTNGRDKANQEEGPNQKLGEEVEIPDVTPVVRQPWQARVLRLLLVVLGVLLGALLLVVGWWYVTLHGLSAAARTYEEMSRVGRLLGAAQLPHQTPGEYGESLALRLIQGQEDVRRVVALYVKQQYSRHGLSEAERRELEQRWHRLRLGMWCQALKPRWRKRRPPESYWVPPSSLRAGSSLE